MNNIWKDLAKPIFALAPMEDVTDTVFRQMIRDLSKPDLFSKKTLFFTEFTNCDGLQSIGRSKVINRLKFSQVEQPIIAQVWGKKPENFYKTAKELKEMGFLGIDINMGCPERSVIKSGCGGALINNPSLAKEQIQAVKEGSKGLPVSVKTRIGFKEIQTEQWLGFLLDQDLAGLTVHGRTVKELSEFPAHWEEIGKAVRLRDQMGKKTVILGNGDVKDFQEGLLKVKEYGVDGIMIGRGVFQNPFAFSREVRDFRDVGERLEVLLEHTRLFVETWGDSKHFPILKKFFKIYIQGFPGASDLRAKLMEANNLEEVNLVLASQVSGCTIRYVPSLGVAKGISQKVEI